jgi:hypothetical protein
MDVILQLLKENNELRKMNIELLTRTADNGTKKAKLPAVRTLDTKTGKVYHSHAAAGMAVAPEFGLKVHNFVWYELVKGSKENPAKCPNRFKDISEEEYQKILAKQSAPVAPATPAPKK